MAVIKYIEVKKGNLKTLLQLSALAYEIEQILQKQIEDDNTRIIVTTIQKLSEFVKRNTTHPAFQKHLVLIFD